MRRFDPTFIIPDDQEDEVVVLSDDDGSSHDGLIDGHASELRSIQQQQGAHVPAVKSLKIQLPDSSFQSPCIKLPGGSLALGDTVKLHQGGTYLRIVGISEDGAVIRCIRLCRLENEQLGVKIEGAANELCILQDAHPGDEVRDDTGATKLMLEDFAVDDILPLSKVALVLTNYLTVADIEEKLLHEAHFDLHRNAVFFARRKYTSWYDTKRGCVKGKPKETSIERLKPLECDGGWGRDEWAIRLEAQYGGPDYMQDTKDQVPVRSTKSHLKNSESGNTGYTAIDAFCCSGFASEGLKKAKLRIKAAFDHDPVVLTSYQRNNPRTEVLERKQCQFLQFEALRFRGHIDVLHLSFPCQYFSPANRHINDTERDFENRTALLSVGQYLIRIHPRQVTMEQTSGLAELKIHREDFATFVNQFVSCDYDIRWKVQNLAEYGNVSQRRRLIVFASAPGELLPAYPSPTHNKDFVVRNALLPAAVSLADVLERADPKHANHDLRNCQLHPSEQVRPFDARLRKLGTITCRGGSEGKSNMLHPSGKRLLTIHELQLCQQAPRRFTFVSGTRAEQIGMVGNAAPSHAMYLHYKQVVSALEIIDEKPRRTRTDGRRRGSLVHRPSSAPPLQKQHRTPIAQQSPSQSYVTIDEDHSATETEEKDLQEAITASLAESQKPSDELALALEQSRRMYKKQSRLEGEAEQQERLEREKRKAKRKRRDEDWTVAGAAENKQENGQENGQENRQEHDPAPISQLAQVKRRLPWSTVEAATPRRRGAERRTETTPNTPGSVRRLFGTPINHSRPPHKQAPENRPREHAMFTPRHSLFSRRNRIDRDVSPLAATTRRRSVATLSGLTTPRSLPPRLTRTDQNDASPSTEAGANRDARRNAIASQCPFEVEEDNVIELD